MDGLCLHKGGVVVTRAELAEVPVPYATKTYQPVGHVELTTRLLTIAQDNLPGFTMTGERYGLARAGQQLFAVLNFKGDNSNMGLAFGYRNSYDKSMPDGFAGGASVFVSDNMCLSGDILIMRRHTRFVWDDVEAKAIEACNAAIRNFRKVEVDSELMAKRQISRNAGYAHLGCMFGNDLLSARQIVVAKNEWMHASHTEFAPLNAWSLYNAVTESLKSCPPTEIMEKHVKVHEYFNRHFFPQTQLGGN